MAWTLLLPAGAGVGNRGFQSIVALTQMAPSDTLYVTSPTRLVLGGDFINLTATVDKNPDRVFRVGIQDGHNCIGRKDASTLLG